MICVLFYFATMHHWFTTLFGGGTFLWGGGGGGGKGGSPYQCGYGISNATLKGCVYVGMFH